jgi:hypothetical protein
LGTSSWAGSARSEIGVALPPDDKCRRRDRAKLCLQLPSGTVLPPGASVDLTRSALFFDGARITGPILLLVGWAVLGTLLALALGGRIMDPADTEAAAAAGAAV